MNEYYYFYNCNIEFILIVFIIKTDKNRKQLDVLTRELVTFIKDGDTAVQIVPMLKEYLEINVKNDDQLVKMAGIVQRLISTEQKAGSEDEYGLSEEEKNQLLSNLEDSVKDIQEESDKINNRITSITN